METIESQSELTAWREVHKRLTEAVIIAKEAVAAAKAQRRYWLEEIAANLTTEGKLTATSVWKKPTKVKIVNKRKSLPKAISKRKKSDDTETDEDEPPTKKKKVVRAKVKKVQPKRLKLSLSQARARDPDDDDDDDDDDIDESTGNALEVAVYSTHEQDAVAALLSGGSNGGDMSHIPEELRPFMASLDTGISVEAPLNPVHNHVMNPYGGKRLRSYDDDDDDDEDDDDDDDDSGDDDED